MKHALARVALVGSSTLILFSSALGTARTSGRAPRLWPSVLASPQDAPPSGAAPVYGRPDSRLLGTADSTVLEDGQHVTGELVVGALIVPSGVTIHVDDDAFIVAEHAIVVEGDIVVGAPRRQSSSSLASEAPRLSLVAGRLIDITGRVLGGQGSCWDQATDPLAIERQGGQGSEVFLQSPVVFIDGSVVAGRGGSGGPQGRGGTGGNVVICGEYYTRRADALGGAFGGDGGPAGRALLGYPKAPDGGDGGSVEVRAHPSAELERAREILDLMVADSVMLDSPATRIAQCDSGDSGQPERDCHQGEACPSGFAGPNGGNATGGEGTAGANGANGSSTSPNGQPGGTGGLGGNATGGSGANGSSGRSCCNPPVQGGAGGKGGNGGNATGGQGGPGGNGGNAYHDGQAYLGYGGNGGSGGSGAMTAQAGNGGKGGDGGKQSGMPGAGGDPGSANAGAGGTGGNGGVGNPNGAPGASGGGGGTAGGTGGSYGNWGGECP